MKRLLIGAAVASLLASPVFAQSGGGVVTVPPAPYTQSCGSVSVSTVCWGVTETWTTVGTTYAAPLSVTIIDTASAAGSLAFSVSGGAAGTTNLFSVDKLGGTAMGAATVYVKNPTGIFVAGTTGVVAWTTNSSAVSASTLDAGLSRGGAGEVDCGNGTQADKSCKFVAASHQVGSGTVLTLSAGELGFNKITATASAAGAAGGKIELVCGTNAGSAKLIAYAGTSTTAVTILDNIGTGVTGC